MMRRKPPYLIGNQLFNLLEPSFYGCIKQGACIGYLPLINERADYQARNWANECTRYVYNFILRSISRVEQEIGFFNIKTWGLHVELGLE